METSTSRAFNAFDDRINSILVAQIYARSNIGIAATIINSSILVFLLWDHVRHPILLAWLITSLAWSMARLMIYPRFLKAAAADDNLRHWKKFLIIGIGVSGVLWGFTAIFLFPEQSVAHQAFIAFVLAGMVAGAVGVYAPIMPAFLAFSIPTLTPLTIRFFLINDEMHMAMGAMAMLFAVLTFTTAKRISTATRECIGLKESFAKQLEDRTAELKKRSTELEDVNGQLRHEIEERKSAEQKLHQLNEKLEMRVADRTLLAVDRAKQLQVLAVELIEAEERERQRISALLHDDLQQILAAARFRTQMIYEAMPQLIELMDVEQMLLNAIAKCRRLSHELNPAILLHSGLTPSLQWLARQMREQYGLEVQLTADKIKESESTPTKILLYRAVQELLFNVVKHAGVPRAQVHLSRQDHTISITVGDKGKGFDPNSIESAVASHGLGLLSLRERANHMGGQLSIQSSPGHGSQITFSIPTDLSVEGGRPNKAVHGPPDPVLSQVHAEDTPSIRIMIVDDHRVMRQGLIRMIAGQPDIQVAGEASNGREAIELARQIRPDAILMDISMPEVDGIEATRYIKKELPETRIIGLSMFENEPITQTLREAGGEILVSKTASMAELLKVIYGFPQQASPK